MYVIKPQDNWATIFSNMKAGDQYQLIPGGHYEVIVPSPLQFNVPNVSIDAQGATVNFTIGVGSSVFKTGPKATGCSVIGMQILAAPYARVFYITADGFDASFNTFLTPVSTALMADVGGTNAEFYHNKIGPTNSCSMYSCEDGTEFFCNEAGGSFGEVTLRVDCASPSKKIPKGVKIVGNTIGKSGTNLKGCVELRCIGEGSRFAENILGDYLRLGQDYMTSNHQAVQGLVVSGNLWKNLPPTSVKEHLMIKGGTTVIVGGNDFLVDATMQALTLDGPSMVSLIKNTRHLSTACVPQAKLYNPLKVAASCVLSDDGGAVIPFGS